MLGFQRKAGSKQATLHWHGSAPRYDDSDPVLQDRAGSNMAFISDDDAAMAAADNMGWDML